MMLAKACGVLLAAAVVGAAPGLAQTQETEPNNTPATANTAVRGSSGRGTMTGIPPGSDNGDFDYWVITVAAGDTIYADVDANEFGSGMNTDLYLYASDGVTLLAGNMNWDGMDPHITYVATASGPYFVVVTNETAQWPTTDQPYTINFFEVKCPVTDEVEPNNSLATSNRVTLGATVHGAGCPAEDWDVFKIALEAGTTLEVRLTLDPHERPAFGCACEINGWMELLAPDGTTQVAADPQGNSDDPDRFEYTVQTAGTYYLRASLWPGGIRYTYTLEFRSLAAGAGDPVVVRADGLVGGGGVAVDRLGNLFITADGGVWRVPPDGGGKTLVTSEIPSPGGLGWDAFGNLLVSSIHAVYKLSPSGQVSTFIENRGIAWIAVAPDGTLWLTDFDPPSLRHYDPFGTFIEAFDITLARGEYGPRQVAIGPGGEPYFSTSSPEVGAVGTSLYRLVAGHQQRVLLYRPEIIGFAFDVEGNIYVASYFGNRVVLHGPTGAVLTDPLAHELARPVAVAFGRNSDGATNSRLYVLERGLSVPGGEPSLAGRLVELNPAGIRAPGAPVGYATSAEAVADLLRSGGVLGTAERAFLDAVGNRNGRYDVGDLRAFLLLTGTLSPSATRAPATP